MEAQATEKKVTLGGILETLNSCDQGLLELTPEEQQKLGWELAEKVDNYYYMLEKFEAEITRLQVRINNYQATKKTLENNMAGLEALMLHHMKTKEFERVTGNEISVLRYKKKAVAWTLISEPDALTARRWPLFVRREYTWNKKTLGAAILKEPDNFKELGHVVEKDHLKFSFKKEL